MSEILTKEILERFPSNIRSVIELLWNKSLNSGQIIECLEKTGKLRSIKPKYLTSSIFFWLNSKYFNYNRQTGLIALSITLKKAIKKGTEFHIDRMHLRPGKKFTRTVVTCCECGHESRIRQMTHEAGHVEDWECNECKKQGNEDEVALMKREKSCFQESFVKKTH